MQAVAKTPPTAAVHRKKENPPAANAGAFGKMVCFHPRYRVGVRHDFENPRDFLRALVEKTLEPKAIVDYLLSGRCKGLELQYSLTAEVWDLIAYDGGTGDWDVVDSFAAVQGYIPDIAEAGLAVMSLEELFDLVHPETAMLPVFLPDASSPFLKTSLTAPAWSAGQIGWIYAEKNAVNRRYRGTRLEVDRIIKAEAVLQGIVEGAANPRHRRQAAERGKTPC